MLPRISNKDLKKIDVVVLCGGMGTRLREVINDRPKPMAEINKKPFLDILLDYISTFGFKRFIFCVGYMADVIKSYYANRNQLEIIFSVEDMPLGTGGAIKKAQRFIHSNPFLVVNGDSLCKVDLSEFYHFHVEKNALLSMVVVESKSTGDYGLLSLDNTQRVVSFDEKGKGGGALVNAGIYLFDKQVFSLMPSDIKFSLEYDLFTKLVGGKFYGCKMRGKLIDIGTPERFKQAVELFNR